MRLHNFCIDRRLQEVALPQYGGLTEIQPGRLHTTPLFDAMGRPVHFLDIERGPRTDYRRMPKSTRRDELVALVAGSGLHRPPPQRKELQQKAKKKRGGNHRR